MSDTKLVRQVENRIILLRGQKVMLDFDLAELYQVETRALKQAVGRNKERFPADFVIRLNAEEIADLRSQTVISSSHGGPRYGHLAFTEQGIAMLSSVLRSKRAVQVNIAIMRAFVHLREMLASNSELARKIEEMEKKYDQHFQIVFDAIKQLIASPTSPGKEMGFHTISERSRATKSPKR